MLIFLRQSKELFYILILSIPFGGRKISHVYNTQIRHTNIHRHADLTAFILKFSLESGTVTQTLLVYKRKLDPDRVSGRRTS